GEGEPQNSARMVGQRSGVVAAAEARHCDPGMRAGEVGRRESPAGVEPCEQGRRRRSEVPPILAAGVEVLPELGRAYVRTSALHASPWKLPIVASAPAASNSSEV